MTASAEAPFDPRRLRDAFGCFGTGVTVVTAFDAGGAPVGLTANSFTSVSLDPPLLLFCLDRRSRRAAVLQAAQAFAVNVLHAGQEALSTRFARGATKDDHLSDIGWDRREGAPVLQDAMAVFACAKHAEHDGGDHLIVVGRVLQLEFRPEQDPLLYFQGRYRSVHVPD